MQRSPSPANESWTSDPAARVVRTRTPAADAVRMPSSQMRVFPIPASPSSTSLAGSSVFRKVAICSSSALRPTSSSARASMAF
jgi:hypothetical protein